MNSVIYSIRNLINNKIYIGSKANKGRQAWNKGIPMSDEQKEKIKITKSKKWKHFF